MPMYNFTVSITVVCEGDYQEAVSTLQGTLDGISDAEIFGTCIESGEEV